MMTGGAADLKSLVKSCLDDNPNKRPTVVQVSVIIKRAKDICGQKSSHDGMRPIVWWAEVSSQQQSQVISSLSAALEKMTINNEQLKKEVDLVKAKNKAMKDENNAIKDENKAMKYEMDQQKNEIRQLRTENQQLKQLKVNNNRQMDENEQFRTEVDMIKAENIQLKIKNDDLRGCIGTSELHYPQPLIGTSHKLKDSNDRKSNLSEEPKKDEQTKSEGNLKTDKSLVVDTSDALCEQDKMEYTVHTKTTLQTFKKSEFSVIRKHEEFLWLHDRFIENKNYTGITIPPPPPRPNFDGLQVELAKLREGKATMTKEEYNKMKQELEAKFLAMFKKTVAMHEIFLQRLTAHPLLRGDRVFAVFLEFDGDVCK